MNFRILALAVTAALGAAGAAGAAVAVTKVGDTHLTVFSTQARLEVSAEGKVVAVKPDPKLSALVAEAVQSAVGAWRFTAPLKDGKPVGGVTYVQLSGCAAPVDGGVRLAFDCQSNGPRRPVAPPFPSELARAGAPGNSN